MQESKHKIESVGVYLLIYGLLLGLLIATVSAATVDMGPWNVVTALVIAVVKALLVILFFMHVRHSSRLTWIFAGAAFLWLTLLLGLTLSEYWFRPAPALSQSAARLEQPLISR
jgi:cytochrome c oxidase subunit IV